MATSFLTHDEISQSSIHQAAAILARRRLNGEVGPVLDEALRPKSLAEAVALQQQVMIAMAEPVAAWKCLLPTPDKIVVAPIYRSTLYRVDEQPTGQATCALWPSTVPASAGLARIEPELAFVLQQDLPPRAVPYTEAEIDAAIGTTHLALELIQSRFSHDSGAGFFDQLADGLFNQGLFLGPAIQTGPDFIGDQFALQLQFAGGQVQQMAAVHPNQRPRAGLYWLVNYLSNAQLGLKAGQAVITGSYAGVLEVPFAQEITFQYGDWGQFVLQFVMKTS